MKRLRHEACRRIRPYRRSAAVLGAGRYLTAVLCLIAGQLTSQAVREIPALRPWYLTGALLTAAAALTPLRFQTDWQIGRLCGTLNENDLGFLACSSSLWLWGKALLLRLMTAGMLIGSVLPGCLLYAASKSIWLTMPPYGEGLLTLLTVLHLGFLAAAAALLPLRITAVSAALPYCLLKLPHESPARILRAAFRLSRGQSAGILRMRICTLPFLLLPFTAMAALPALLAAEQLRCERAWRHQLPQRSSAFSGLELHAAEPAASFTADAAQIRPF